VSRKTCVACNSNCRVEGLKSRKWCNRDRSL